ncbi:DEAD/DEAH box helicase [Vibrio sp. SBT000027]|uniref:DEAD/DEAH box helicase n=1 Tax=Vibrio sp. SBT000027 TaxID=1803384 RepID=UPI00217D33FF|nr:DEAD/DEAH box helicase [Vibrio sp. SBT000027]
MIETKVAPQKYLENVKNGELSPFLYLKKTNQYLSEPTNKALGRELLIRALEENILFEKHAPLFQNLVRKAGLYPYLKKYFQNLSPEKQLVLDLYQSNFDENFIFHSMQARIFNLLASGNNVVLSAPTSMGKSAIVDALIAEDTLNKIVIVVPTIALIDETRRRIQKRFSAGYQIIHHGSQEKRRNKVIYILTQERVNERTDLKNIDLFIVDEFYKLAYNNDDSSRVIALNIALSKLITVSKQFYLIGPYIDAIRGMETIQRDYVFIPSEFNTVALNIHEYNIAAMDLESKNRQLEKIVNDHNGQTIIYCKSATSIAQISRHLQSLPHISESKFSYSGVGPLRSYHKWLTKHYGKDWGCTNAIQHGIGIHHGALPRAIQQKNIDLFNLRLIKTLICTSTLIEGVNTSAENIIIYDNRNGTPKIDNFTHKNISGRAGRMNQYLVGNVFCLETLPKQELQTQVVDLPLGQQDNDSPINLLAGIQPEHLSDLSYENLNRFAKSSDVPIEIIRKHSTYDVDVITEAYDLITRMSISEMEQVSTIKKPKKYLIILLTDFIKMVELGALRRLNLHHKHSDELQNRIGWYIYSKSHSAYIKERIKYIYELRQDQKSRTEDTDKELKIIRNIFRYAIPRSLQLLEDLLNYEFSLLELPQKADLGYLIHLFEHCHLSSAFSALEEMGISIETLEKLKTERLSEANIDSLVRYLRWHYESLKQLNSVDKMFIKQAIS